MPPDRARDLPLDLADVPARLIACTPARLTAWVDCPRRYRMSYVDRPPPPKGPPWAHQTLGAEVHAALAQWGRLPVPARSPERAGAIVSAGWRGAGFRDDAQSAAWRDRAREMVERYVDRLDPADEPVGVERTVATKTAVVALSGRVDRLDRRGRELVVVDYKTGRRPRLDGRRPRLAHARGLRGRGRAVAADPLPPGRAAPPAVRQRGGVGAQRRLARPAAAPGRRDRRRDRGRDPAARRGGGGR